MVDCRDWAAGKFNNNSKYGTPFERVVKPVVRINGQLQDIPEGYKLEACTLPDSVVTSDNITNIFNSLTDEQIHNIVAALLSSADGQLLENRSDGLYYGIVAPPDIADLYIDAVLGNDTYEGTQVAPLRTIREAVNRGAGGLTRNIWLYEGQEHVVDPAAVAEVRGGKLFMFPYGPLSDLLPPVAGDNKFNSAAGKALGTKIVSAPHILVEDGLGTEYEFALAFYPTNGATIHTRAISFRTAPKLPTGILSSYNGMLNNKDQSGNFIIQYGVIDLVDTTSRLLSDKSLAPYSLSLGATDVIGTGKILEVGSIQYIIDIESSCTPFPMNSYFSGLATANNVFTSINTSMTP